MSQDDVLFGYRLQLVDLAGRVGVAAACRTFGVHRSTYYAWKRKIEREGLGALRPRERTSSCGKWWKTSSSRLATPLTLLRVPEIPGSLPSARTAPQTP